MKTKRLIKKGDICALVLANCDCDTPLFIGRAQADSDERYNDASFNGTYFFDDAKKKFVATRVSYDKYSNMYSFKTAKLEDVARSLGYVWVWTVVPSPRFK